MKAISVNLSSLAPDSFILGDQEIIKQFSPWKVLGFDRIRKLICRNPEENISINKPLAIEIHPTSYCQLSCTHCSYQERNRDEKEMASEVLERILFEIEGLGIESLIYSGGGDPLSWSKGRLGDFLGSNISSMQSLGTNAIGLLQHIDENSLNKLRIIQINVNGYNRESFMKNTGKDFFHKFRKNLLWLFKHRTKSVTQLSAKILVDRFNYRYLPKYLQFCFEVGFDAIIVKLAGNFESRQNLELHEKEKETIKGLILNSNVLERYLTYIDAITTKDNIVECHVPEKCWFIELGLYALIRSNGDVYPCVVSPYTPLNSIGNLYKNSFQEIWEKNTFTIKTKLHQDMKKGICNLKICRGFRYTLIIQKILNSRRPKEALFSETSKIEKPALL